MVRLQTTISPIDGSVYVERELADAQQIDAALSTAVAAQQSWKHTPLADRMILANAP